MNWFDKLTIDCLHDDLLECDAEAIACNVNIMFDLNYSLGQQLLLHCGPVLSERVESLRNTLPDRQLELGQAVWIDAPCPNPDKAIVFFGWWAAGNEFTSSLIYKSFVNSLRAAFAHDCRSIAFPLFGSGSGSMSFQVFQSTIYQVLDELNRLRNSDTFPVEDLFFISTDKQRIEQLDNHLARLS